MKMSQQRVMKQHVLRRDNTPTTQRQPTDYVADRAAADKLVIRTETQYTSHL
jgi:hypothetical protein